MFKLTDKPNKVASSIVKDTSFSPVSEIELNNSLEVNLSLFDLRFIRNALRRAKNGVSPTLHYNFDELIDFLDAEVFEEIERIESKRLEAEKDAKSGNLEVNKQTEYLRKYKDAVRYMQVHFHQRDSELKAKVMDKFGVSENVYYRIKTILSNGNFEVEKSESE